VIRFGEVWLDPTRIAGFTIQAMRYQGTSGYGVYAILDAGGRALLERYEDEADAREYVAQLVKEHDARRSGGCREEKANADGAGRAGAARRRRTRTGRGSSIAATSTRIRAGIRGRRASEHER